MKRFSEFLQLYFIKGNLTLDRSVLLFLPYLSRYAADRALRQILFIDKKLKLYPLKSLRIFSSRADRITESAFAM